MIYYNLNIRQYDYYFDRARGLRTLAPNRSSGDRILGKEERHQLRKPGVSLSDADSADLVMGQTHDYVSSKFEGGGTARSVGWACTAAYVGMFWICKYIHGILPVRHSLIEVALSAFIA